MHKRGRESCFVELVTRGKNLRQSPCRAQHGRRRYGPSSHNPHALNDTARLRRCLLQGTKKKGGVPGSLAGTLDRKFFSRQRIGSRLDRLLETAKIGVEAKRFVPELGVAANPPAKRSFGTPRLRSQTLWNWNWSHPGDTSVSTCTTQFLRARYDKTQFGLSWSSQFVNGSLGNKRSVACMEQ